MRYFSLTAVILLTITLFPSCDNENPLYIGDTPYADKVVSAPGATGSGYGKSSNAADGVHGAGCTGGNASDVYSLSNESSDENTYIILRWSGRRVTNGTGTDFAVFENPFDNGTCGSGTRFMDQLIVSLSIDGTEWVDFPYDYTATDETTYSNDPADWSGFAGVTPVLFNEETNPVDPFSAANAGGDHFDLDDLDDSTNPTLVTKIKNEGFIYIKLTAAGTVINSDTVENFVHDSFADGPDVDGVYGKYLEDVE